MKRLVIAVLLAAACANGNKKGELPQGGGDTWTHQEFTKFRPVAVAILPVAAPVFGLRMKVRRELYRRILSRKYSPFKLEVVDAHMESGGTFGGHDLEWDATLKVEITRWKSIPGTDDNFEAAASARLTHRSGEVLWKCSFYETPFKVSVRKGQTDLTGAAGAIAGHFLQRLPERPPLPRE